MRSNRKTQERTGQGMDGVDWGWVGDVAGFTTGQETEQWREGFEVRGAGKFPISFWPVQCHGRASLQVTTGLMAHDGEGSGLRECGLGLTHRVAGVIGGWRVHPAFQ